MAEQGIAYRPAKATRLWLVALEKQIRESLILTETVKVAEPQESE